MGILASLWACDSLSDPEKTTPSGGPTIARVTGALVGLDAPANARVTVVWRTTTGLAPGADAAIIDGRFTVELGAPPADVLAVGQPASSPPGADASIGTQTVVSGMTTGLPIREGIAGFIVYADTNANARLDLDSSGLPSDTIIGGNAELVLTHFQDGTSFDYEKLRDRTGTLPHEGYNLAWTGGSDGRRWFPLENIELELRASKLPDDVCSGLFPVGVCADNGAITGLDGGTGDPPIVGYDASASAIPDSGVVVGFDSSAGSDSGF